MIPGLPIIIPVKGLTEAIGRGLVDIRDKGNRVMKRIKRERARLK